MGDTYAKRKNCAIVNNKSGASVDVNQLKAKIIELIDMGVTNFLFSGTDGDFEPLCAKTIRKLKKTYPDIKCILVTTMNKGQKQAARHYDEVLYPEYKSDSLKSRFAERRRYMPEAAAFALCYAGCLRDKEVRIFEYANLRIPQNK